MSTGGGISNAGICDSDEGIGSNIDIKSVSLLGAIEWAEEWVEGEGEGAIGSISRKSPGAGGE